MTTMQSLKPQHFDWRMEGQVAVISLNRPERKNPLTFESYAELRDTFRDLGAWDDVKAVVVTGAGGNFCSGGDVVEIIGPLTEMDQRGLLAFTRMTGELVKAMRDCPQPVIAAVDGICAGAGAILAMASDLRLVTPAAKTAFLFVRVGLAGCDMGACAILPRLIGRTQPLVEPRTQFVGFVVGPLALLAVLHHHGRAHRCRTHETGQANPLPPTHPS